MTLEQDLQDKIQDKIHLIEQLRAHKEMLKKDIERLLELIQQDDIQIRDIRQSLPELERQVKESTERAKYGMTLEEAKHVLEKYTQSDYTKAKEIYNTVNDARKTIEELTHG